MLSLRFSFRYFDSFVTSEVKIILEFLGPPVDISPSIITNGQSFPVCNSCIAHYSPVQDLLLMIFPLLEYLRCNSTLLRHLCLLVSNLLSHKLGWKEVALSGEQPLINILLLECESLCLG
jgi:hypothetical protein